jgi:hypothetical protein
MKKVGMLVSGIVTSVVCGHLSIGSVNIHDQPARREGEDRNMGNMGSVSLGISNISRERKNIFLAEN